MFKQAKMEDQLDPLTCQVIITIFNLAATVLMMSLIDRFGRRTLLLGGGAGMFFFMSASTVLAYSIDVLKMEGAVGWLLLGCLCGYITCFGIGWGGVPWVYPSEIFPMDVKEMAMATSVGSQWLANFLVALLVVEEIHFWRLPGTLLFYSIHLAVNFLIVYVFVRETAGRTLEEMDELFGKRLESRRLSRLFDVQMSELHD